LVSGSKVTGRVGDGRKKRVTDEGEGSEGREEEEEERGEGEGRKVSQLV